MEKKMLPNNFTIRHGHFIIEGHDGTADILISPDPATGSDNGLIGAAASKEELMDGIDEIMAELKEIKDSVFYSCYNDESCWNTLRQKRDDPADPAKPTEETEVA